MMETVFPFALLCFTSLFTITSPLSTMPVFLTMTQSLDEKERRAVAIRSTLVACCALLLFVLAGSVPVQVFRYIYQWFPYRRRYYHIPYRIRYVAGQVHTDESEERRNQRVCQRCFRGSFGNPFTMRAGCDCQCDCPDAGSPFV